MEHKMKIDPATKGLWVKMDAHLLQIRAGANEIRAGVDKALKLLREIENFEPPDVQDPEQMAPSFMVRISEHEMITSSSVCLICDACKHRFWYEFTAGCMRNGGTKTSCPECGQEVKLTWGEIFEDGSRAIDILGATRGLHLVFTAEGVTDDAN